MSREATSCQAFIAVFWEWEAQMFPCGDRKLNDSQHLLKTSGGDWMMVLCSKSHLTFNCVMVSVKFYLWPLYCYPRLNIIFICAWTWGYWVGGWKREWLGYHWNKSNTCERCFLFGWTLPWFLIKSCWNDMLGNVSVDFGTNNRELQERIWTKKDTGFR